MLMLHAGRWAEMPPGPRDAVIALTLDRYVDAIHLPAYLSEACGLPVGSAAHEMARAARVVAIERGLRAPDPRAWIVAVLHHADPGAGGDPATDGWTALAAARVVRGARAVPVSRSVGAPDSSLPTHALLQGWAYPTRDDFDPDRVPEHAVLETTRWVAATAAWAASRLPAGALDAAVLKALVAAASAEVVLAAARLGQRLAADEPVAAWLFNVRPRVAISLRDRLGLDLVPMYAGGAAPTPQALASALDGPYFHHWRHQLCRELPAAVRQAVERDGPAAAVRHLAQQDLAAWQDREVTLPYLVHADARLRRALDRLEAQLAQGPYQLQREAAHA